MEFLKEKNIFKLIIVLIVVLLLIDVLFMASFFKKEKEGIPIETNIEKNLVLEDVYKKEELPDHNTVCFPNKKFLCKQDKCVSVDPTVFNLIIGLSQTSSNNPAIARCDSNGCDVYESVFEPSGDYANIQPIEPKGMIMKMSIKDLKYTEITTLGLDTYISYGYCLPESDI